MSWTLERIMLPKGAIYRTTGMTEGLPEGDEVEVLTFLANGRRTGYNLVLYPDTERYRWWSTAKAYLGSEKSALLEPGEESMKVATVGRWELPIRLPKRLPKDPHKRDMAIVAYVLRDEAHARDWCDEFESFLHRVNPLLSTPLVARGGKK